MMGAVGAVALTFWAALRALAFEAKDSPDAAILRLLPSFSRQRHLPAVSSYNSNRAAMKLQPPLCSLSLTGAMRGTARVGREDAYHFADGLRCNTTTAYSPCKSSTSEVLVCVDGG